METLSKWVGLIGGALGIVASIVAAITVVLNYFATRDQLRIVDCYQYYRIKALDAQANQLVQTELYRQKRIAAASAQVAYEGATEDVDADVKTKLLAEFKKAVDDQNKVFDKLNEAQQTAKVAIEEQGKCGHRGESNWED